MKRCIVYFPFKVNENHPSASNIRPLRIIEGFKDLGYEVDVIKGYGAARKDSIKALRARINSGEKYEFVYMESSTEPTLLTEANHIPTHPFLDFEFLRFCKKKGIKIGLFYRDIHWRFDQYKNTVSLPKRLVAYIFYYYDLLKYKNSIDVLFLPSLKMKKYIPVELRKPIIELPSGCEYIWHTSKKKISDGKLSILYVGGLSKELYNIEGLVKAVYEDENYTLDICCREGEWKASEYYYGKYLNERIKFIHKSGDELDEIAMSKDLFSLVVEPTTYWEFAMPMKLFSYIAYGKPIIGVYDTACGEFIEKNNLGYITKYKEADIKETLKYISENYQKDYEAKTKAIAKAFEENTWKFRAQTVAESLLKI